MLANLLGIVKQKSDEQHMMGNVPHGEVVNQGLTASGLDIDSGRFAPKAFAQIDVETFGSQNSPMINQDVVVRGDFDCASFTQYTDNNLINDNGLVIINPVIDEKTSNMLLYQGYGVIDGDL